MRSGIAVNAAHRLLAAMADEARALSILEHLGFKGLRLVSNGGGLIRYKYTSYDEPRLNHIMGEPKSAIKAANIQYPYGTNGLLAVWPGKSEVLLRNRNKVGKESIELPEGLKNADDIPHAVVSPPLKTGTENDDQHVPVVHITELLHQQYLRAQAQPKFRVKFMQDLWLFLNQSKFGGKLQQPKVELMKGSAVAKMRVRGYWAVKDRTIKMHPQIFNATQNFFVEIFLHEMCHEAVTENWGDLTIAERLDNNKHAGHGTAWAKWMRHVGLNPLRFDPNEATTYMDEQTKTEVQKTHEQWQKSKDEAEALGLHLLGNIRPGSAVIVRRLATGLEKGWAVCMTVKAKKMWAILPVKEFTDYVPSEGVSWHLNTEGTIYDDPHGHDMKGNPKFEDISDLIIKHYQKKKDKAAATREFNKMVKDRDRGY